MEGGFFQRGDTESEGRRSFLTTKHTNDTKREGRRTRMKTGIGRKEAQEAQKRRGGFFNREGREGTRSLGESGGMMNGLGIVAHG